MYAIEAQNPTMIRWLLEQGIDVEEPDDFGGFPLILAAQNENADCVRVLLEFGAKWDRTDEHGNNGLGNAATPEIVELFIERGGNLSDLGGEMRQRMVGHKSSEIQDAPSGSHQGFEYRTFGTSNPERMNNPHWDTLVRTRISGWAAMRDLALGDCDRPAAWCYQRFGQSITKLPDGRFVEIGGEHEDHYDPDFCIYNDIAVHHGDGNFDLFGYPEDVFPPTDFHTATYIDCSIWIIGCLGYNDQRKPGFTPVFRLDCETFAIEEMKCTGEMPGWIHAHKARIRDNGNTIEVTSGRVQEVDARTYNDRTFCLNLLTNTWKKA